MLPKKYKCNILKKVVHCVHIYIFQGGLMGMIIGLVLTLWVGIGGQLYPPTAEKTNPLPLNTAGCNNTINQNYTTITPWTSPVTLTPEPE